MDMLDGLKITVLCFALGGLGTFSLISCSPAPRSDVMTICEARELVEVCTRTHAKGLAATYLKEARLAYERGLITRNELKLIKGYTDAAVAYFEFKGLSEQEQLELAADALERAASGLSLKGLL